MINTGMGLCVLPQEADRLNEGAGSLWVRDLVITGMACIVRKRFMPGSKSVPFRL